MSEYAIEMLGITKRFPGIIANDNITLQLKKGEIHALLGENGAGKSTLMSVLFGLYQPEEGEIHKDGKKVEIKDPNDANDLGMQRSGKPTLIILILTRIIGVILILSIHQEKCRKTGQKIGWMRWMSYRHTPIL